MECTTLNCTSFGHPEFRILCERSVPQEDVDWLAEHLEGAVRAGARFRPGEHIQIGWMLNRLSEFGDGTLLLMEPDMRSVPVEWQAGATQTLLQLRMQKDAAESLGLGSLMQFPTIQESAILGMDVSVDTDELIVERTPAQGPDSGWFVGSLRSQLNYNDPENLRRVSLYEAAILCPAIIMFLAMPAGTTVRLSESAVSIARGGVDVAPSPDSFLGRLFRQRN